MDIDRSTGGTGFAHGRRAMCDETAKGEQMNKIRALDRRPSRLREHFGEQGRRMGIAALRGPLSLPWHGDILACQSPRRVVDDAICPSGAVAPRDDRGA